ncbi:hypothetical protein ACFX2C_041626 [Malus domestica]
MTVDTDPFPAVIVGMVDARLPKSKGKEKIELAPVQHIIKKNAQPRLKIDLFSNAPPTEFSGPAIVQSMSTSSDEENDRPVVLCSNCKARVMLTEPKEKLHRTPIPRPQSTISTAPSKKPSEGQRIKVFERLGPKQQTDDSTSVRRRLDFDAPFYNEEYYSRNSSSSCSSAKPRSFKPPEPRDQRWYSYNSPTGMYTALSKSQKRQRQRIDCLAR